MCLTLTYLQFFNKYNVLLIVYRNKFVQQLENISNNANIMMNDVDYDIPIELLAYIDDGTMEVNPERFQYELFHSTEESSDQLANKLLKLKVRLFHYIVYNVKYILCVYIVWHTYIYIYIYNID